MEFVHLQRFFGQRMNLISIPGRLTRLLLVLILPVSLPAVWYWQQAERQIHRGELRKARKSTRLAFQLLKWAVVFSICISVGICLMLAYQVTDIAPEASSIF